MKVSRTLRGYVALHLLNCTVVTARGRRFNVLVVKTFIIREATGYAACYIIAFYPFLFFPQ